MADKRGTLTPSAYNLVKGGESFLGRPITISSGYRDPAHNASVGGAKGSDHLTGNGFDVSVRNMTPQQANALENYYRSQPNTYVTSEYADGHIHVSYRGPNKGKEQPGVGLDDHGHDHDHTPSDNQDTKTPGDKNQDGTNTNDKAGATDAKGGGSTNQKESYPNCNPKLTGSGKPIGGRGQNGSTGSGKGGGQGSEGRDGSANRDGSPMDPNDNANKLKNDGQANNIKFNKDRADEIYTGLRDRGYSHEQAVAVMGHWQNESKFNTTIVGDNGTSYGLAQWHNDRWDNLRSFAASRGQDPASVQTQLDFFDHEMSTSYKSTGLKNATSIADASAAMNKYERFQGWNNTGNFQVQDRLRNANTFDQYFQSRGKTS